VATRRVPARSLVLVAALALAPGDDERLRALDEKLKSTDGRTKVDALFDLAKIGTPDALRRIVPLFKEADRYVSDRAISAFAQAPDATHLRTVAKEALGDRDARVRGAVLEMLTFTRTPIDAVELATPCLGDADSEVRLLALEVLLARTPTSAPPALPPLAAPEEKDDRVRATALLAWARIDAAGAHEAVERARSDKAAIVRASALLGLEASGDAIEPALAALEDPDHRVRLTAIAVLERSRSAAVVPKLIPRIAAETGRPRERVALALRSITGRDFGEDAAAWSRWWSSESEGFAPPPRERKSAKERGDPAAREETRVDAPRYLDLPVPSDRVAFLIDVSGSMRQPYSPSGAAEAKGKTRTRLDHAADALRDTLAKLPKGARATVIVFNDQPLRWKGGGVEMDAKRAEDARKWVLGIGASRSTNVNDALDLVLDDPEIDAIYLLSDGAPSAGKRELEGRILAHVRRVARFSGVEVNTLGFGLSEKGEKFLRDVASATGGRFAKR